jgi:hypothetical protein
MSVVWLIVALVLVLVGAIAGYLLIFRKPQASPNAAPSAIALPATTLVQVPPASSVPVAPLVKVAQDGASAAVQVVATSASAPVQQVTSTVAIPVQTAPPPAPTYLAWSAQPAKPVVVAPAAGGDSANMVVCQAEWQGPHGTFVQPGWATNGTTKCHIGYWGAEVQADQKFAVLDTDKTYNWGNQATKPIKGGFAAGEDMYVCRADVSDVKYAGKTALGWDACLIGLGGEEKWIKPYEFMNVLA